MKVKFLTDHGYPSLVDCVGKVVEASRLKTDKNAVIIKGKDLIAAGAKEGRISPDYTYYMSLGVLPDRGGKGFEIVEE
ncbi:hypothetical protein BAU67_001983 [Escherichia coli]|nr:hypothetical protein [Escherichia coli]EMB7054224.1 hypothetical protein [Escherichia coli]